MVVEVFLQFLGKTLGIEKVIDAQGPARNLVLVRRSDPLAGRSDPRISALRRLASAIERRVIGKDQRTARADLQSRANIDPPGFQFLDLVEQVVDIQHDTVADITADPVAHDSGGDKVQLVDLVANDQGMAGVMPALKPDNSFGMVGQPVDDLPLSLVAPLCSHYDYVFGHFHHSPLIVSIIHCPSRSANRLPQSGPSLPDSPGKSSTTTSPDARNAAMRSDNDGLPKA